MISTIVSLLDLPSWDPATLTAATVQWPGQPDTVSLTEAATTVSPDVWVERGTPVIAPSSLDANSGGVSQRTKDYQGDGFQVRRSGTNLSPGDLLVPPSPSAPALLLTEAHAGATASARFLALKPASETWGLWLWATLSSTSGQKQRAAHAADAASLLVAKRALLNLEVPVPPGDDSPTWDALRTIEASTHRPEAEAVETWWRTTHLTVTNWAQELAMRSPLPNKGTVPLADYCSKIQQGRQVPRQARLTRPQSGALPVVNGGVLAGGPVRYWTAEGTVAEPGDVLVAEIGPRPHAQLATQPVIVSTGVYALRLKDPAMAAPLVAYLNGQEGFGRRQLALTGTAIMRISKRDIEQLAVVSEQLLAPVSEEQPGVPLSVRLERALWT